MEIKRGQIYFCDMSPVIGCEQGGLRPVLVISNDIGNKHSPVVIVAPITSQYQKKKLPTQVLIGTESGLKVLSMVMCEQLRTVDKRRLTTFIGEVKPYIMRAVDGAIKISLELGC
jgi:mRNA interferase MazF